MIDIILNTIGWLGAFMFAICSVPQAIKIFRTHKTEDLSWGFLWLWFGGEILSFAYVLGFNIQRGEYQYSILFNYTFNTLILFYIIGAKFYYERQ